MRRLALALIVTACTRSEHAEPAPAPVTSIASAETKVLDAGMPPLAGAWQIDFEDGAGTVSVPLGAREPRPILVVLHGGSDRPGWECGAWRGISNAYPFLVCPRGQGSEEHLYWSSPDLTKKAIDRVLAATRAKFGPYVSDAPPILAGFSLGAGQAALLAQSDASLKRVALVEGAYATAPTAAFASSFAKHGERMLFACTTHGACQTAFNASGALLAKRGVPARLNDAGTYQHGMWDVVVRSLRRDFPWFVQGAEGWSGYAPPAEDAPLPGKTVSFE